jgi:hypothetical protein
MHSRGIFIASTINVFSKSSISHSSLGGWGELEDAGGVRIWVIVSDGHGPGPLLKVATAVGSEGAGEPSAVAGRLSNSFRRSSVPKEAEGTK